MSAPAREAAAPTVATVLAEAAAALAGAGIGDARREARLLLARVLGLDPASLFGRPERPLDETEQDAFATALARRLRREPVSRILGGREFWSLPFCLSPDTLDPRPDSETLVQAVLDTLPDRAARLAILDLGTGTGCLLLALLSELPNAWGLGVDIAPGAAATAAGNARNLGLADRAGFAVGDWTAALVGRFDAILINPPYIPDGAIAGLEPEVARWDPRRALAGGCDGLDAIRTVTSDLAKLLSDQGVIAMEVGAGQDDEAAAVAAASGLTVIARKRDLGGGVRCMLMRAAKAG